MKRVLLTIFFIMVSVFQCRAGEKAPINLGGFTLGNEISQYQELLETGSFQKIRYNEYITEAETRPLSGFKSGLIAFGLCEKPDRIVRIKLKLQNSSKAFFDELLKRYEKRFGEPDEYRGDPFKTVIAWKWSFKDKALGKISLILQHNTLVQDEKVGNAVKLSLTGQIEKERECFEQKQLPNDQKLRKTMPGLTQDAMWKLYIPY